MKSKVFRKKLTLNKKTVANLGSPGMKQVLGGDIYISNMCSKPSLCGFCDTIGTGICCPVNYSEDPQDSCNPGCETFFCETQLPWCPYTDPHQETCFLC
jgi:hypothetical protein